MAYYSGQEWAMEATLRRAAEHGDLNAARALVNILEGQHRRVEAAPLYEILAEAGDVESAFHRGVIALQTCDYHESEQWLRRAADGGNVKAEVLLRDDGEACLVKGRLLLVARQDTQAEIWYRRAVDAGDIDAMFELAAIMVSSNRLTEAMPLWRRAATAGDARAANEIGKILTLQEQYAEAEPWLRQAVEGGEATANDTLGIVLWRTGRESEAEEYFRQGVSAGDDHAFENLGGFLIDKGEPVEAEQWLRRAFEVRATDQRLFLLGLASAHLWKLDEAERYWLQAAEQGNAYAAHYLHKLLEDQGRMNEARRWPLLPES